VCVDVEQTQDWAPALLFTEFLNELVAIAVGNREASYSGSSTFSH
jgi:hypothetical protein